jgi:hypothetical protein
LVITKAFFLGEQIMTNEYYIDRIGNISVQGPVVSIDLGRMMPTPENNNESVTLDKRLTVTMTGQNFINMVNALNNSVKTMAERAKAAETPNKTETNSDQKIKQ